MVRRIRKLEKSDILASGLKGKSACRIQKNRIAPDI